MANARIQFSTAPETKWRQINPALREGELVVSKNSSNRYELRLGGPNGTKFSESVLVWSQTAAEKLTADALSYKNTAAQKATAAAQSANAAANSQNAAKTSAANAAASADAAALSESKLGALSALKGVASQAEAEAGAVNDKIMTPLRVKQVANNYLSLSGGTMRGELSSNVETFTITNKHPQAKTGLYGGRGYLEGASLVLCSNNVPGSSGGFNLTARVEDSSYTLSNNSAGSLIWRGQLVDNVEAQGNNYIRYASGLQICWGEFKGKTNNVITVALPMPYLNAYSYTGVATANVWGAVCNDEGSTATSFIFNPRHTQADTPCGGRWLTIGKWK